MVGEPGRFSCGARCLLVEGRREGRAMMVSVVGSAAGRGGDGGRERPGKEDKRGRGVRNEPVSDRPRTASWARVSPPLTALTEMRGLAVVRINQRI